MTVPRVARAAVVAFAIVALLGLTGLALAGAADRRDTAFTLEVDNIGPVTTLHAGDRACQAPVPVQSAFGGLRIWIGRVRPPGTTLAFSVVSPAGASLAAGGLALAAGSPTSASVHLDRAVPAGSRVSLCFQNRGPQPVALWGSRPQPGSGALAQNGRPLGWAASVVLLTPHSTSLVALLPTIFSRASVFRPAWMGAWTYWLLLAGLAVAFPLAALGLRAAARADL